MAKKKTKIDDLESELTRNDEISDEILLNEDLDDPLLDEMDAILQGKSYIHKPKIPKTEKKTSKISVNKNIKISNQIVKEFQIFLLKKSKIYEEISFETILRKIPQKWQFSEPILIDVIEALIENKGISSFDMKMTAHSLKFYQNQNLRDKKK